jgi:hypothetical protein
MYLTNRELAQIARRRPSTLEGLREIPGIGEAKCRDFGAEALALVARVGPGATSAEPEAPQQSSGEAKRQPLGSRRRLRRERSPVSEAVASRV